MLTAPPAQAAVDLYLMTRDVTKEARMPDTQEMLI